MRGGHLLQDQDITRLYRKALSATTSDPTKSLVDCSAFVAAARLHGLRNWQMDHAVFGAASVAAARVEALRERGAPGGEDAAGAPGGALGGKLGARGAAQLQAMLERYAGKSA